MRTQQPRTRRASIRCVETCAAGKRGATVVFGTSASAAPIRRVSTPGRATGTLTGAAGLASFGVFCRRKGIDAELQRRFRRPLKNGVRVVYPMEAQLRLLMDANVAG